MDQACCHCYLVEIWREWNLQTQPVKSTSGGFGWFLAIWRWAQQMIFVWLVVIELIMCLFICCLLMVSVPYILTSMGNYDVVIWYWCGLGHWSSAGSYAGVEQWPATVCCVLSAVFLPVVLGCRCYLPWSCRLSTCSLLLSVCLMSHCGELEIGLVFRIVSMDHEGMVFYRALGPGQCSCDLWGIALTKQCFLLMLSWYKIS